MIASLAQRINQKRSCHEARNWLRIKIALATTLLYPLERTETTL
jgi:hypothetical protein